MERSKAMGLARRTHRLALSALRAAAQPRRAQGFERLISTNIRKIPGLDCRVLPGAQVGSQLCQTQPQRVYQ